MECAAEVSGKSICGGSDDGRASCESESILKKVSNGVNAYYLLTYSQAQERELILARARSREDLFEYQ